MTVQTNAAGRPVLSCDGRTRWAAPRTRADDEVLFSFIPRHILLSLSLFIDRLMQSNWPATSSLALHYQILSTCVANTRCSMADDQRRALSLFHRVV